MTGKVGDTVEYTQENRYNGFGQRVEKTEGTDVTNYFYDGTAVLYTTDKAEDADLSVVIGNLLDNAIDALVNCKSDRFIKITMKLERNILFMEISNSYVGELCIRKGKLISSKTDGRDHGIGLQNVGRIAEKYSGKMELDYSDSVFKATVMLYEA